MLHIESAWPILRTDGLLNNCQTVLHPMRLLPRALLFGVATEMAVMAFALLMGSYAIPVFTSPVPDTSWLSVPGRLLHIPGDWLAGLLCNFLFTRFNWHLSWWPEFFWLFTFQAAFWALLWYACLCNRDRRNKDEIHVA